MACKTPGATYATEISPMLIEVAVALDAPLKLSERQAAIMEAQLHAAFEDIIADYIALGHLEKRGYLTRWRCDPGKCVFGFGPKCTRCGNA